MQAHEQLLAENIRSRVVSMPSWDIFEHESPEYRDSVLPPGVKARIAVEQVSTLGWERCRQSFSSIFSDTWRSPTWRDCWLRSCGRWT